jgi:GNAT superfamily N-acetyltransferase
LPEWFGVEQSVLEYIEGVRSSEFFTVYEENIPIGMLRLKINNAFTAEIYVMGILKSYHREGIGRRLMERAELYLRAKKFRFLMVKTLSDSDEYEPYRQTRAFYRNMDFNHGIGL